MALAMSTIMSVKRTTELWRSFRNMSMTCLGLHSKQMSEIERNAFNREKRQINMISAAKLYEQVG